MTREAAAALAAFINEGDADTGGRYFAEVLPLGEHEAWVILSDRDAQASAAGLPPVVDAETYLADNRFRGNLSAPCLDLLERWLRSYNVVASGLTSR